uniref:Uncharacterized protein n=1 Tax=Setaria viridis TaxID=4556 RepID=A0A4U6TRD3_SETVI|nr:hypothetical protein SEVIR_7G168603v2 [Setaria viridis]
MPPFSSLRFSSVARALFIHAAARHHHDFSGVVFPARTHATHVRGPRGCEGEEWREWWAPEAKQGRREDGRTKRKASRGRNNKEQFTRAGLRPGDRSTPIHQPPTASLSAARRGAHSSAPSPAPANAAASSPPQVSASEFRPFIPSTTTPLFSLCIPGIRALLVAGEVPRFFSSC